MEIRNTPSVASVVDRVRAWLATTDQSKARIAELADIDEKTVRLAARDDWNPTKNTLQRLEALIPADWQPRKRSRRAA